MITSLTVGLGVAYSIHLSERYTMELGRRDTIWQAMHESVTGTGGALLGSAATTVGGFGVLSFAILPALQQFGIITGLTIVYAFLASVLVLPSLLVLWTRYLGPGETGEVATKPSSAPVANGGATEVNED
jgi:predicted RND superfamily exporter protein